MAHADGWVRKGSAALQDAQQRSDLLRAELTPFESESYGRSTYNLSVDSHWLFRVIFGEDHLHPRQGGYGDGCLDEGAAEADVAHLAPANGAPRRPELDAFVQCASLSPPMFHISRDASYMPRISWAEGSAGRAWRVDSHMAWEVGRSRLRMASIASGAAVIMS